MNTMKLRESNIKLPTTRKSKVVPIDIPNAVREMLPLYFKSLGFKTGAEIGVEYGFFSELFCKAGMKMYSIDPWKEYDDYRKGRVSQEKHDSWCADAMKRLSPYDCTIIRKYSMDAVKLFSDNSLDFVYIDGNHDLKHVTEDLMEWTKKVKPGGVVAGHDYIHIRRVHDINHVIEAVNAYTQAFNINPWYVLGTKDSPAGEFRDKQRSWMFFKRG